MTAVFPSQSDTFIPSHQATGKMVIDYARNIKKFAVNKYTQIVPVQQIAGYYLQMTVEEAGRIQHSDLRNYVWYDGQDSPEGVDGSESHEFQPFRTTRYAYPFRLGDLTIDQATWNILAQHSSMHSRKAMTARTQLAISKLTNTNNYAASHVIDVTAIPDNTGNWAQSTTARSDILRTLTTASEKILDDTLAAIDLDDLVLVINSACAAEIKQSQELVDHIKGSPDALAQVRGELPGTNTIYGLPDKLYGIPLVVEATRKITSKKGATKAVSQVLPAATPFLCARPGKLEGVADAPNFSTCVCFEQEAMTVETKRDADNRRTKGRVVDNLTYEMVAPASGVLFQAAV